MNEPEPKPQPAPGLPFRSDPLRQAFVLAYPKCCFCKQSVSPKRGLTNKDGRTAHRSCIENHALTLPVKDEKP